VEKLGATELPEFARSLQTAHGQNPSPYREDACQAVVATLRGRSKLGLFCVLILILGCGG
jgi:hypothetical protein